MALHLARDLPGTDSKTSKFVFVRYTVYTGFAAAWQQIVSKLDSYASGRSHIARKYGDWSFPNVLWGRIIQCASTPP
jgi:hypothetical protein